MAATVVCSSPAAAAGVISAPASAHAKNQSQNQSGVRYGFAPAVSPLLGKSGGFRSGAGARKRSCVSVECSAAGEASSTTTSSSSPSPPPADGGSWVPVIPTSALPRGERRLVRQDGENVLLLWYKDDVYAVENTSPAEGAYSEGMFNAKLTPVCASRSFVSPNTWTILALIVSCACMCPSCFSQLVGLTGRCPSSVQNFCSASCLALMC
ncbi:hypothetical protein MPTK1_1g07060 [Marchantia polymorpha subsp. ruderalis]